MFHFIFLVLISWCQTLKCKDIKTLPLEIGLNNCTETLYKSGPWSASMGPLVQFIKLKQNNSVIWIHTYMNSKAKQN